MDCYAKVVDAQAGPGTKSMTKFKWRNHNRPVTKRKSTDTEAMELDQPIRKKKTIRKKKPRKLREMSPCDDDNGCVEDLTSPESSRCPTPCEDELPHKRLSLVSSFIDLTLWKGQKTCCGTVFRGPCSAVLVDARLMKASCPRRSPPAPLSPPAAPVPSKAKAFSDNSSDSGYDESSNHSLPQPIPSN